MARITAFIVFGALGWLAAVGAAREDAGTDTPAAGAPQDVATQALRPADERFAAETDEVPDFQRHVLPLLGRLGCNGRACHGSFQGQGGFQLSLFGYDFGADLAALAGGDEPRVDRPNPEESLILRKPTLREDHEGGRRMAEGSWQYRLLHRWISAGAPGTPREPATLVRIEVHTGQTLDRSDAVAPMPQIEFTAADDTVQLRVVAHWGDGSSEEVTPLCRFRTNDESIATVSEAGLVQATGRGSTHVIAFYDNGVAPVQVILPVTDLAGSRYPDVPTPTKIDELVVANLRKLGIVPSELSTDAEFLRRVSLDITGTLPAPAEIEAFLADTTADKRARKVDELLERPAYAAWWATRFSDWTGNNPRAAAEQQLGAENARQWYEWLRRRLDDNMPYDQIVEGIVMAVSRQSGQSFEEYCEEMSSYYGRRAEGDFAERETMPHFWSRRTLREPKEKAHAFSYAFLGVRLQCAECHKHPFDQWTKDDFDQFTAFFTALDYNIFPPDRQQFDKMQAQIAGDQRGNQAQRAVAQALRQGEVVPWRELFVRRDRSGQPAGRNPNPRRRGPVGRVITPRLLGGEEVLLRGYADPREPLMEWLRAPENPYFTRAIVNRIWASYFNVGIIDPPDDLNLANPPSNEALLDHLTRGFAASGYDLKWLHREIATSRTYQLSWRPNETNRNDERHFSRAVLRRLPAEVAYDAVVQATASDAAIQRMHADLDSRAIGPASIGPGRQGGQRGATGRFGLRVFGLPERTTNCDCERSSEPNLLQTLFLRNDQEVIALIERREGWLAALTGSAGPSSGERQAARGPGRSGPPRNADSAPLVRTAAASRSVDVDAAIRSAYLRTVSRRPSDEELQRLRRHIADAPTTVEGLRDLIWALVNSKEFILNH